MTDDPSEDQQSDTERLKAELARKEREIEELKRESSRTKNVQDDLWSHDIYLKARRTLLGGVIAVLGVFSALGFTGVNEFYKSVLKNVDEKLVDYFKNEATPTMDRLIQARVPEMIQEAKERINARVDEHIDAFINDMDKETSSLIKAKKTEIEKEIAQLMKAIELDFKLDRVALSDQARQIRIGMMAPAKAERLDTAMPDFSVGCDPNYLDDAQIARVGVRQLSEATGKSVRNRLQVFENTFFLDVRGMDETAGAAEANCILAAVDRVVYGADPRWYSPSEFVRIDRENDFRFTISGWGPTELSAQVYFIGRRDPETFSGNLTMIEVARADEKKYLGDAPQEFR